jgi:sulfhydrogenase subunit beta (sulfur reductase)
MMSSYVIKKGNLSAYLKHLNDKFELWTPLTEDGITQFQPYNNIDDIDCKRRTRSSLKSFFLPQRELMFQYSIGQDEALLEQTLPEGQTVIFGVKPCDARAMQLNARLLLHDETNPNQDTYFQARLENTILIGFGCDQPGAACFCHAVGGDPFGRDGLDALITDLGEQLLMTWNDSESLAKMLFEKDLMDDATDEDLAAAQQIAKAARNTLAPRPKLKQFVDEDIKSLFDLPVWEETALRCLNCGICTYLCPTCTCFDMMDHFNGRGGNQSRCWDSCMFGLFTQHASGHNPRPGKKERLRQRFMHKLRYFPERHGGDVSCVGCGRCVLYCPVNIDIREIANQMTEHGGNCA